MKAKVFTSQQLQSAVANQDASQSIVLDKNNALVDGASLNDQLAAVLALFIALASGVAYFLLGGLVKEHDIVSHQLFSTVYISLVVLAYAWFVINSGRPMSDFGIHLQSWRQIIKDSLLPTAVLVLGATIFKIVFMYFAPHHIEPLFHFSGWGGVAKFSTVMKLTVITSYILFCLPQEFIVRGVLQNSLKRGLVGMPQFYSIWLPRIIANVAFASVHTLISLPFAALVFVGGMVWSWMSDRDNSILGATVSHIIVGSWMFFVLGIGFLVH